MNSKQRRQKDRKTIRIAERWIECMDTLLDDLESGATTIDEARQDNNKIRAAIIKACR